MASSYNLRNRLKHNLVKTRVSNKLTGGWENSYIVPGGTRECHPDFTATPLGGDSPYNFLLCSRKIEKPPIKIVKNKKVDKYGRVSSRGYSLYDPDSKTDESQRSFFNTKHPELKSKDYIKDPIRFRGIGNENLDTRRGEFRHVDHFFINSDEPPEYDEYYAIQPYHQWKNLRQTSDQEKF